MKFLNNCVRRKYSQCSWFNHFCHFHLFCMFSDLHWKLCCTIKGTNSGVKLTYIVTHLTLCLSSSCHILSKKSKYLALRAIALKFLFIQNQSYIELGSPSKILPLSPLNAIRCISKQTKLSILYYLYHLTHWYRVQIVNYSSSSKSRPSINRQPRLPPGFCQVPNVFLI